MYEKRQKRKAANSVPTDHIVLGCSQLAVPHPHCLHSLLLTPHKQERTKIGITIAKNLMGLTITGKQTQHREFNLV